MARKTHDFCTREGAELLARRVIAYWRERGHAIRCEITRLEQGGGQRGIYCVRSSLKLAAR